MRANLRAGPAEERPTVRIALEEVPLEVPADLVGIGAIAFNYLKVYAVASSQYWQLVLGCVLVVLVMVLPTGIVGTIARFAGKLRRD